MLLAQYIHQLVQCWANIESALKNRSVLINVGLTAGFYKTIFWKRGMTFWGPWSYFAITDLCCNDDRLYVGTPEFNQTLKSVNVIDSDLKLFFVTEWSDETSEANTKQNRCTTIPYTTTASSTTAVHSYNSEDSAVTPSKSQTSEAWDIW